MSISYKSTTTAASCAMLSAGAAELMARHQHIEGERAARIVAGQVWLAMHRAAPIPQDTSGNWIMTASGRRLHLSRPQVADITIEDIALGLSRQFRFNGHSSKAFTVAQHSVMVSYMVCEKSALQGLLHDAPEAYIGDLPSPLKELCPDYQRIEQRLNLTIMKRFGLPERHAPEVKYADMIMLATEKRDLMPQAAGDYWPMLDGIDPLPNQIETILSPEDAREHFLERFAELARRAAA